MHNEPITAIISAIAFISVAVLIIGFLIKEAIMQYKNNNKEV